jgi:hypothetical protein
MSGFAVFSLKYPSLLQFAQDRNDELVQDNLKSLYGIARAPSDTYLRERLDNVSPEFYTGLNVKQPGIWAQKTIAHGCSGFGKFPLLNVLTRLPTAKHHPWRL